MIKAVSIWKSADGLNFSFPLMYVLIAHLLLVSISILRELIDHIDVYETEVTGKNRTQRIMIHYKFVGVIEIPDPGDNYTADTRKGVAVEYITQTA